MLVHRALLVKEVRPMAAASHAKVADIIEHHFGFLRYEFHVIRSSSEPFVIIFFDRAARNKVFARGKAVDGPVELRFHPWDADGFGEHTILPYHIKLSVEGLPHHAWFPETVDNILGDEVVVHHVDQISRHKEDLRFFACWAFCHNPSRIPQMAYLTLADRPGDPRLDAHMHFSRPRNVKRGHIFRILIHIESVEDLSFYHQPQDQVIADGKIQLREFHWIPDRSDGDLDEEISHSVDKYCHPDRDPRDDVDKDRNRDRRCNCTLLEGVSRWFGNRQSEPAPVPVKGSPMEGDRSGVAGRLSTARPHPSTVNLLLPMKEGQCPNCGRTKV
jgi:hypothetical protein